MADAILTKTNKKLAMREVIPDANEKLAAQKVDKPIEKGKRPVDVVQKASSSKTIPSGSSVQLQEKCHSELMAVLTHISSTQKSQGDRLTQLESQITELKTPQENEYDYENGDFFVNEEIDEVEGAELSINPENDVNNNVTSVFKGITSKYNIIENVDHEVDNDLAVLVNSVFRDGVSDEKMKKLIKETDRPVNCEALTKTRVNALVWGLLTPYTKSVDDKLKYMQEGVIKASVIMTKLLDKSSDRLCKEELESGADALGLLGQVNKMINIRRRTIHKTDLNKEYHHLCSPSNTFTDMLYGDDVSKDVKDIQDMNRVGTKIRVGPNYPMNPNISRGRGKPMRGVFRGRVMKIRGRGRAMNR